MLTITGYRLAKNKDEKEFIVLELQGEIELIQSLQTGRHYASARKCSITSTFSELTAKALIGKQLPGSIKRVESLPYDFVIPNSGEIIQLAHTYQYTPEEVVEVAPYNPLPERMFSLKRSLVTS